MQLRYVFSEAWQGLRRNLSMTIALVVTMFVSLTLVGMGLLLNSQAHKAEQRWGSQLQITVYLCNDNSRTQVPTCAGGEVTQPQKDAVLQVLRTQPEVRTFDHRSKEQAYAALQRLAKQQSTDRSDLYSAVTVKDMNESYVVTLKNPQKYQGVREAVQGLDGVENVQDLHNLLAPIYKFLFGMQVGALLVAAILLVAAVLEVSNTIRLTAMARRREIGIMRLVGAGSLSIQLPFLLETLLAAIVGIALAGGALLVFMYFVVYRQLRASNIVYWIDWWDAGRAIVLIAILGVVMTVVPTLLLTRKYLKV